MDGTAASITAGRTGPQLAAGSSIAMASTRLPVLLLMACSWLAMSRHVAFPVSSAAEPATVRTSDERIKPIEKSDAEWKKLLTRKQFEVTRGKATEPAYSGKLW